MTGEPLESEAELLWEEFHAAVNMSSEELRTWLLTEGSGETAFGAEPDLDLPSTGREVVQILGKRKRDLSHDDLATMRNVVEFVGNRLAQRPRASAGDEQWRHALMSVGHDPLKPGSPRSDE